MRLKSLELHGFKSFVDKTTVRFQPGITAVVGPNGCGKSNVVDAMRWVMGEQSPRRLRGRGMDDVIFAGSEGRSPVGMAEVVLTFDNSKGDAPPAYAAFSEIQISRRLYRTGESEYLLNKAPSRLRDIQDFFRDTGVGTKGYTIVEQGRVAEIVSAKAEERRALIEEAAGIGKYKARRREAESKIGSTEQNLLRVTDVLGEIKRQIGSIERQAKKAARYKRLRETLRVLELSLARDDRAALVGALEAAARELQTLRDQLTALETQVAERELGVQAKRIELAECERVLTQGSESLLALRSEIKECEGQIDYGRRERESLAELAAARRSELSQLREQRVAQQNEASELAAELEGVERSLQSEAESLEQAEVAARGAREALQALERERDGANAQLVEVLTAIARAEDRVATVDDRRAELDARMRSADEGLEVGQNEAARIDQEQRDLEEGLRNLLAERDRLMGALRTALDEHQKATEREQRAAERLRVSREQAEGRRARLESLREVVERADDVAEGTRHLLAQDGAPQRYGLRGLVRDALEVDREVEGAVEAVLAERAEAVVVDRAEGAVSALEALRSQHAGRGLFLAPPPADADDGFVPLGEPLAGHVRARSGYEDLVRALFRGVYLVDDLREVVRVYGQGRLPATFATAAGDVLTQDGVVRGGASTEAGASPGALARVREVRDLTEEVARIDARVAEEQQAHREAQEHLARSSDELENLRNRHHTAALAVANHEKDLERTRERVKALGEAHEGRVSERGSLLAEVESLTHERARLEQSLEASRQERVTGQRALDALGLRLGSATRELQRLETTATEQRVEHSGRAERRDRLKSAHERALAGAQETADWIARREQEIGAAEARREELAGIIEKARETLEVRLRDEEAARAGHDEKREAFERASGEVNELEEGLRELRGRIGEAKDAVSQQELKLRETEMKRDHLDESIREKWDVELASWEPPVVDEDGEVSDPSAAVAPETAEGEDGEEEPAPDAAKDARANAALARLPVAERREQLEAVRKKLHTLGDVNLGAIEEHEELKERFRFLSEQKEDLEQTLTSLRDAIARINRTSRKRFRETFEAVSKRFAENFPRLFRGGRASLTLTEAEDVLDAGIEIMAMPPGKRLQNVNLLSGGEKTLTAIALLVAVFQVRPSPFFLLDEVDAALDDANVGRFNELVTELAAESQFVLITHNKRTIEVADVLYGVTMERKGISKMVAVEMH
ncbi:MAG: chromosome segregation protein SMC [Myxococcota bacterium]